MPDKADAPWRAEVRGLFADLGARVDANGAAIQAAGESVVTAMREYGDSVGRALGAFGVLLGQNTTELTRLTEVIGRLVPGDPYRLVYDAPMRLDPAIWYLMDGKGSADQGPRWAGHVVERMEADGRPYVSVLSEPVPHDVMIDGLLLRGGIDWCSGGAQLRVSDMGPGSAVEVECRIAQRSQNTRAVVLTWPRSQHWPDDGEINICELGNLLMPTADGFKTNNHWRGDDGKPKQDESGPHPHDMLTWSTFRLERDAGELRFMVDGSLVRTITEHVPQGDMFLSIQTAREGAIDSPRTPGGIDFRAARVYQRAA